MQTNFTPAQLADPHVAESESILRKCVHCGFCTATCPTYVTLGNELDSPRGRIYLIKDMLENGRPADTEVVTHIDRCLSCLACVTTCPSGVDYMHLVDHARIHIEDTYKRPVMDRLTRNVLAAVLPYPGRFRLALNLARPGATVQGVDETHSGAEPLRCGMLNLAPRVHPGTVAFRQARTAIRRRAERRGRVAILDRLCPACARSRHQRGDHPASHSRSASRWWCRKARSAAVRWSIIWAARSRRWPARAPISMSGCGEIEAGGLDAIIITASGCGTTIKDYGHMLRLDPVYAGEGSRRSRRSPRTSPNISQASIFPSHMPRGITVAYHSACSMQHGQRITHGAETAAEGSGFHRARSGGRASLLRLGRHLQHHAVGNFRPS